MSTVDVRQDAVKAPAPRSRAGEAFNDVLVLVLRLHGSFTAAGETLARPAGQTLARWVVLDQCRDAPATVSDIAWRDNPQHQRAKLLELTPAGRAALHAIDAAQHRWCDTLGTKIGEPALRRTAAALQRITGAVDNIPPTPAAQRSR